MYQASKAAVNLGTLCIIPDTKKGKANFPQSALWLYASFPTRLPDTLAWFFQITGNLMFGYIWGNEQSLFLGMKMFSFKERQLWLPRGF